MDFWVGRPHHIKGTYCRHDLSLLTLTLMWFSSGFSIVKLLFCSLWKKVTMHRLYLRSGKPFSTLEYLPKLFGIPLNGKFVYSPSFIYLSSHLFTPA